VRLAVIVFRGAIAGLDSGEGLNLAYSAYPPMEDEAAARKKFAVDGLGVGYMHPHIIGQRSTRPFWNAFLRVLDNSCTKVTRAQLYREGRATGSPEDRRRMRELEVRIQTCLECASAIGAVVGAVIAVSTSSLAVEMGFLAAVAAYSWWSWAQTFNGLFYYVFGRGALQQTGRLRLFAALDRVSAFVRLTVMFVLVTALLDDLGVVSVVGLPASEKVTGGQAAAFYVWNSLNAIPGLDVPSTLHWQLTHPLTDLASRALLLTYKAFILLPLVFFAYLLLQKIWSESPWSWDKRAEVDA
jgi:uncharacterized membrane protein